MFRIRRSLPKIRSDPARLPRPLQGLAMTSATFSTSKRINEMYRPASRTVSLSKSPFWPFAKLPSKLQNVFCSSVLQFCRCGGLLNAKGHPDGFLSLFSSLRNLRLDWFFDTQTQKRNVPPGKPDGQLVKKSLRVFCQAAFKIAKLFVVLFCNFAAAAGYLTRKDTLTVSFPSFLPSETSGWAAFSPARFAKTKCTARQAGRYIS